MKNYSVAMVVSRFNEEVTQALHEGAIERLKEFEFSDHQITEMWVPGAIELPLTARHLAETNQFAAIICLGAVIRGETTHYDYVCEQASYGCQKVALETKIPVIFGVLTTENIAQALDRVGGAKGHKGRDAVDAAVEMVEVIREIEKLKTK